MLLSVGADISIRIHVLLLLSLTTISGLLLFILQSVWVAKCPRIVAPFASAIGSYGCYYNNYHY